MPRSRKPSAKPSERKSPQWDPSTGPHRSQLARRETRIAQGQPGRDHAELARARSRRASPS